MRLSRMSGLVNFLCHFGPNFSEIVAYWGDRTVKKILQSWEDVLTELTTARHSNFTDE